MTHLYLDVDGVLLGKSAPDRPDVTLARHAREFLAFALSRFRCYWLSTHVQGDTAGVMSYLRPYCPEDVLALAREFRPTRFDVRKTDAIVGPDFYWVDDAPLGIELAWLRERNVLQRWVEANTRKRPDDLLRVTGLLAHAADVQG